MQVGASYKLLLRPADLKAVGAVIIGHEIDG